MLEVLEVCVVILFALTVYTTIFSKRVDSWKKLSLAFLYAGVEWQFSRYQFIYCTEDRRVFSIVMFIVYNIGLVAGINSLVKEKETEVK